MAHKSPNNFPNTSIYLRTSVNTSIYQPYDHIMSILCLILSYGKILVNWFHDYHVYMQDNRQ